MKAPFQLDALIAVVVILSLAICRAQEMSVGHCPDVTVKQDFDVTQYVGKWYEIRRYFAVFQIGATCAMAEYTPKENGRVNVTNTAKVGDVPIKITGEAWPEDPAEPAKLTVALSGNNGKYWVLDTDYGNYSLVWSCTDLGMFHVSFSWVLSRAPQLLEEHDRKVREAAERNKVDQSKFLETAQEDCGGS